MTPAASPAAALLLILGVSCLSACATLVPVTPCKTYCATADQGYQWAQSANLLDAGACGGYAANFTAGCRQAVRDAQLSANPRDAQ